MNELVDKRLSSLAEEDYKVFNQKIISTNYDVLGVRMPVLKKFAKEIASHPNVDTYLENATFGTYEHILLYGLVLSNLKKYPLKAIFRYLDPLILKFDNWAHVDTIMSSLKVFRKHQEEVLSHFLPLKCHEGEFTKRVFVILLMDYFMDEKYIDISLKHMREVSQGQYYVDMAIAWALSYGLIKYYDKTVALLEQRVFSKFVHNKAIQKARESYRISPETKDILNEMKIK